jgi:hypothetical protein
MKGCQSEFMRAGSSASPKTFEPVSPGAFGGQTLRAPFALRAHASRHWYQDGRSGLLVTKMMTCLGNFHHGNQVQPCQETVLTLLVHDLSSSINFSASTSIDNLS